MQILSISKILTSKLLLELFLNPNIGSLNKFVPFFVQKGNKFIILSIGHRYRQCFSTFLAIHGYLFWKIQPSQKNHRVIWYQLTRWFFSEQRIIVRINSLKLGWNRLIYRFGGHCWNYWKTKKKWWNRVWRNTHPKLKKTCRVLSFEWPQFCKYLRTNWAQLCLWIITQLGNAPEKASSNYVW